jgi:hypothetical protein
MSLLADRRARMRYEVVGVLRGTLEISAPARVKNISGDGALLETSAPLHVGAIQVVHMTLGGRSARVTSRVRHVAPIGQPPKGQYAVGLEFVCPPEALTVSVANLIADAQLD